MVITCVRPGGFAYVTNGTDNTVSPYIIDGDTGALLPSGPPVSTGIFPSAAVVAGTGNFNGINFLYVTNGGSSDVSGYGIDPNTGALTSLAGSPFTIGGLSAPTSIAATGGGLNGSFLYVTNPDSTVSTAAVRVAAAGAGPGPIATLNTQFVYVVNTTDQTITGYTIQGTNLPLLAVPGQAIPTGRGPTSIVVTARPVFD